MADGCGSSKHGGVVVENQQYTVEGAIEQLSSFAVGLSRRRYGRVVAWVAVLLAVVIPGALAAVVLARGIIR